MSRGRVVSRLQLGPIVGHTDDSSTRIWIRVSDEPTNYQLRVQGAGLFPFESTEGSGREFRTAIATASGLRPDLRYRYSVLRRGRVAARSRGTFRTMPSPGSMAELLFCAISCSTAGSDGVWEEFRRFVERAKPHFVLMMGDQVYIDEDEPDVFEEHFLSSPGTRRKALADKYQRNWSREPVRAVMASVPTYMMWDDHDIRDGWGSLAPDSPTMRQKYPRGESIYQKANAYFEDARDVYWHFQACRSPRPVPGQLVPNYIDAPPSHGQRRAMPFAFRCGRLVVLVLDSRGERDVFRAEHPILGAEQWGFVRQVFESLDDQVSAVAVVTPTPIASMDPHGQTQKLLGNRTDDVEGFKRGDLKGALNPASSKAKRDLPLSVANVHASRLVGRQLNLGRYLVSNIDEARDQWSHKAARPEQAALLRMAGDARTANAAEGNARGLVFLSGDVHVGCIYDLTSSKPEYKAASLTSSGISAEPDDALVVGIYIDEDVDVAPGVHSTLRDVVTDPNFGVVQVINTATGAEITPILAHEGASNALGLDLAALL
jgi:hypothetical protein